MVQGISEYVASIVTLILAMTIIELLLPNQKNKKYVMFVCSLIILLSVINPILKVFGRDFDVNLQIQKIQKEMKEIENSSVANYNLEENIYNSYIDNLKNNMIKRLEDMEYKVLKTEIQVNKITYEPEKIEMQVQYDDGYIQPIVIDVFGDMTEERIYEVDTNKIKQFISETYGLRKENIKINGK